MGQFLHQRQFDEPGVGSKGFFGNLKTVFGRPFNPVVPTSLWTGRGPYLTTGVFTMAAAAGGGVAIAQNNAGEPVHSSNAGVTFTASTTIVGPNLTNAAAYESGHFCFSGNTDGTVLTVAVWVSTDNGVSFGHGSVLQTDGNSPTLMLSNGSNLLFMGLRSAHTGGNYFISTDHGLTWTRQSAFVNAGWGNVNSNTAGVWDGTRFVCLCASSSTGNTLIVTSTDGIAWAVAKDLGAPYNGATLSYANTSGGPLYLVGFGDSTLAASGTPAGLDHGSAYTPSPFSNTLTCMFGCTSLIFVFDASGNVAFTDDGIGWGPQTLGFVAGDVPQFACYDAVHDTPMVFAGGTSPSGGGSSYATRSGST